MSRPQYLTTFALVLPLAALAAACVSDNADSGLVIVRNIAPEPGCVVSTSSDVFKASGRIEADSPVGYIFTPLVRNDLVTGDGENQTAKSVFISGARVTIDFYDPDLFTAAEQTTMDTAGLTKFVSPSSGAIDPDGGTATFQLEIVPTELLTAIGAKLTPTAATPDPSALLDVRVQFFGTRSGSDVSSNVFRYPVGVCVDCLTRVLGPCEGLAADGEYGTGGNCGPVQDGDLDCCTDALGGLVCPAVPATPQM
ncbi:MAG: hypothetical protein IPL61_36070 [Myxococcales bacterium]|nr:hypothetical protein [Myxococcales bacterium]